MADIAFELETLDEVPDDHKALYKETDGKFRLSLDAYSEYAKAPVVKKNKELLGKLSQAKGLEKLEKFKEVTDEDWDGFQQWKASQAEGGEGGNHSKGGDITALQAKWQADREKAEKKLKDAHAQQLAEKDKLLGETQGKFRRFVTQQTLTALALKSGVMADRLDSWLKTAQDRFQLNEQDELGVLDDDGDPSDVKPEKFIAETLREKYPFFYVAVEQGGSGASNNGRGSASGGQSYTRAELKDPARYRAARAAAEKTGQDIRVRD